MGDHQKTKVSETEMLQIKKILDDNKITLPSMVSGHSDFMLSRKNKHYQNID